MHQPRRNTCGVVSVFFTFLEYVVDSCASRSMLTPRFCLYCAWNHCARVRPTWLEEKPIETLSLPLVRSAAYFDCESSCFAAAGSNFCVSSVGSCAGRPGGMNDMFGVPMPPRMSSTYCWRSIALEKARRTFGSSNGGFVVL